MTRRITRRVIAETDIEVAESTIEIRRIAPFRRIEGHRSPFPHRVILRKRRKGMVKRKLSAHPNILF
jgi:hypothetical protein